MRRTLPLLVLALALVSPPAFAQPFLAADALSSAEEDPGDQAQPASAAQSGRACDGCPPRRVLTSLLQATYINVFYELANLIRGQDTAKITPNTW
jgi:hypothetical protein